MVRFIFVTFAFLGWAFYELSGGADYEPRHRAVADAGAGVSTQAQRDTAITRAASDLTALPDAKITLAAATIETAPASGTTGMASLRAPHATPAVSTAAPDAALATTVSFTEPAATAPLDLRQIAGNRVNLRQGPGTEFNKIGQLSRGTPVKILQDPGNGWVKLQVIDTRRIGWMADYLVTASN